MARQSESSKELVIPTSGRRVLGRKGMSIYNVCSDPYPLRGSFKVVVIRDHSLIMGSVCVGGGGGGGYKMGKSRVQNILPPPPSKTG